MMSALYPLFCRVRCSLEFLYTLVKKLLRTTPRNTNLSTQRMCPFCGLITPRRERYCMECGKSIKSI